MLSSIVPAPQRWTPAAGTLEVSRQIRIAAGALAAPAAATLLEDLAALTDIPATLDRESSVGETTVSLALDPGDRAFADLDDTQRAEAYALRVSDRVELIGATSRGLVWATRSLLQLLAVGTSLPRGTVVDWPDYPVRGFVLDVGRRFAAPAFVRDLIRMMAWHKLNTFVVHLNDNEITTVSGRSWSEAQHGFRLRSDDPRYAPLASADGAYSRADWDSFEALAASLGVELVPELDGPAHSRSFIVADPSLGLDGGDSDMLDLTNPASTDFMKGLFEEFAPWFAGDHLHFGADEYDETRPDVFRAYFNTMAEHVRGLGKAPVAWGSAGKMEAELAIDDYDRDVVIYCWNDNWYNPRQAVANGHRIVNTNDAWLYTVPFADYYHGHGLDGPALWQGWEPHVFAEGLELEAKHPSLLGAMSAVWNDLVQADYDEHTIHDMIRPTWAVLAQKMWSGTPDGLDHDLFVERAHAVAGWPGAEFVRPGPPSVRPGQVTSA